MKNQPLKPTWDLAEAARFKIESLTTLQLSRDQKSVISFVIRDAIQAERNRRRKH